MENIRLTYNPVENLAFHQLTEFVPLVFVLILKKADLGCLSILILSAGVLSVFSDI